MQVPVDCFIGHTNEAVLYPAEIYAVGTASMGYVWRWRTADGSAESAGGYNHFYDCLEDARAHGFEPHLRPDEAPDEPEEPVVVLSAIHLAAAERARLASERAQQ